MITKEMIIAGNLPLTGKFIQKFSQNGVCLTYYGDELTDVTVDGEDICEMFNIGDDDISLSNRLPDEAFDYLVNRING